MLSFLLPQKVFQLLILRDEIDLVAIAASFAPIILLIGAAKGHPGQPQRCVVFRHELKLVIQNSVLNFLQGDVSFQIPKSVFQTFILLRHHRQGERLLLNAQLICPELYI